MTRQTYNTEVTNLTLKFPQKVKRKGYQDASYKESHQDRALLQALAKDARWTLVQLCEKDDTNFLTCF